MPGSPVNVRISAKNYERLENLFQKTGMPKGRVVDDALTLFFTPPEERSEHVLLRRLDRLEDALEDTNRNIEFNTDMIAEYVWRWLAQQPGDIPAGSAADENQVASAFERFTQQVLKRNGTA